MAREHLEAFQQGSGMGIRAGYYLATEHLRELAVTVLREGSAEAAKGIADAHARLCERLGELEKIHENLAADGRDVGRLTAEMVARGMAPNEAEQKARRTVEEARKLEALDREADQPKPSRQILPPTPRGGCDD